MCVSYRPPPPPPLLVCSLPSLMVTVVAATLTRRRSNDVVHAQDHLGRLGSADQHLSLQVVRLGDAELLHVIHSSKIHIFKQK